MILQWSVSYSLEYHLQCFLHGEELSREEVAVENIEHQRKDEVWGARERMDAWIRTFASSYLFAFCCTSDFAIIKGYFSKRIESAGNRQGAQLCGMANRRVETVG